MKFDTKEFTKIYEGPKKISKWDRILFFNLCLFHFNCTNMFVSTLGTDALKGSRKFSDKSVLPRSTLLSNPLTTQRRYGTDIIVRDWNQLKVNTDASKCSDKWWFGESRSGVQGTGAGNTVPPPKLSNLLDFSELLNCLLIRRLRIYY